MINKGDIFYITMPIHETDRPHSCEIGYRPCVVVSSNVGNRTGRVALVCPITTKIKKLSCNVDIQWTKDGRQSQVLCNHITAVPIEMLVKCEGRISTDELRNVNVGMLKSLGIRVNYDEVPA